MTKICIIQPLLAAYRLPVFEEMARDVDLTVIISQQDGNAGYGKLVIPKSSNIKFKVVRTFRPFGNTLGIYQANIMAHLMSERPDAVMIFANPRYLSFWTTLVYCRLVGIRVFPHGHGIFKKSTIGILTRFMYKLIFIFSTRYICYCDYVLNCFSKIRVNPSKLAVVENSLINKSPSNTRHLSPVKNGILFVGRVRERANLCLLVEAVRALRANLDTDFKLHIVGGGSRLSQLLADVDDMPWVTVHGEVYDQEKIREIAEVCDLGVYPGDAGLSVVHYMSLGLPSVVHDDYRYHLGPEPTYINDGVNGINFSRGDKRSLVNSLAKLYENHDFLQKMQMGASNSYARLIKPSQAEKFIRVLSDN